MGGFKKCAAVKSRSSYARYSFSNFFGAVVREEAVVLNTNRPYLITAKMMSSLLIVE